MLNKSLNESKSNFGLNTFVTMNQSKDAFPIQLDTELGEMGEK